MSILKYKYKAHKFINYAFYIVVFIFGFLLGFTTQKIDFNKLVSQFLMIDNASALTIHEDENLKIDETFIYNTFSVNYNNFNLESFPYIPCTEHDYSTGFHTVQCRAFTEDTFNSISYRYKKSNYYLYSGSGERGKDYLFFVITIPEGNITLDSSISWIYYYFNDDDDTTYTNYNIEIDGKTRNDWNLLDFEGSNLEFNENLFKDNPDVKEVCGPNNKDFVISTNNFELLEDDNSQFNGTKSYSSYGFIWFPYYPKGLESYLYDNSKPDNVWIPDEDETYFDLHPIFHYWFDSKEEIDKIWNLEDPGKFLNSFGYIDKYSYFGWYTHPFVVRYANSGLRQFSIFRFNEDFEFYSTLENGIDSFEKLEEARNGNVCFYIRKDFDVNLLNTDEFGDKYGDITIMGDEKLEISTSVNISNLDSKGLFEKVKLFLNEMTEPIDFVKDYIFDLYDSMPYLLKLFIISVFGLIVIKILIGMVVR